MALTNRDIALSFQHHVSSGALDDALALASDDAAFIGPDGTVRDKASLKALFASIGPMLAGPFEQAIAGTTAEGERVAVQMTASAPLKNGRLYSNRYHFLFIIRDGQIIELTEYCDTMATTAFED